MQWPTRDPVAPTRWRSCRPATLLVNNAGITRDRSLLQDERRMALVLDVNLGGAFPMLRLRRT